MKIVSFLIVLMSAVLLLAGGQAGASDMGTNTESMILAASKDNTLFEPDLSYEPEEQIRSNGSGDYFFSGVASKDPFIPPRIRRGLIAFDPSIIPVGSLILNAELTLHMSMTDPGPPDYPPYPVTLQKVLADWGEGASDATNPEGKGAPAESGDATWLHTFYDNKFWQAPGGDFVVTPSGLTMVDSTGSYTWSGPGMAADVHGWIQDPSSNFGWVLINESDIHTAKRFDSRENPTAEYQPKLVVTYLMPEDVKRVYLPIILNN